MNSSYHLIVCSQSLYLEAVAESLRARAGIEVTFVNPHHPEVLARVAALSPDVIIIENNEMVALTVELLNQGYPLIALDAQRKTVSVLSRRQVSASNMAELVHVISEVANAQIRALSEDCGLR